MDELDRTVNFSRYNGQKGGLYESFFMRANHPTRPLAFWIRYTVFSPKNSPEKAEGELWAVYFDGETNRHLALTRAFPFAHCAFNQSEFSVQIEKASLEPGALEGGIQSKRGTIAWDLKFRGEAKPLYLLPKALYRTRLPSAKSVVSLPFAIYDGVIEVNGESHDISSWVGSQNHNWGTKHTDEYTWGQVAGFDGHPESFFELATARLKLGPFWTPALTPIVLRHRGREFALNGVGQAFKAKGECHDFIWTFESHTKEYSLSGVISAPKSAFVAFAYRNPPGGVKQCLNTKIASCTLRLLNRENGLEETLHTASRAAFEILTDRRDHGIERVG